METSFISKKTNRENDSSGERTRLLFVFFYRTPMCVLILVCNRIPARILARMLFIARAHSTWLD